MGEQLSVARWRRYGKDRLYVSRVDGVRVGWVDLLTGERVLELPDLEQEFTAAVAAWQAQTEAVAPPVESAAPVEADTCVSGADLAAEGVEEASGPTQPSDALLTPVEPVAPQAETAPAAPAWEDLASNVPGQAARERAELELAAQRERSRVGSFLARAFDVKTDERNWRVGAGGEETVGSRLDKLLKRGWHVLHAVPVGERGSDIDHVVIGHGGVYTLNTKTHPGGTVWVGRHQVRVNGHRTDYLRNSRHEAARAERLLTEAVGFPVIVRPVLVFLTGTLVPNVTIKQQPDDVFVCDRMDIPGVFKRAPQRLTPEQVETIYDQARRSTTWRPER